MLPYPCWRGLNLLLLILNSDAKVHKSLDITKHFIVFNMNLTHWWRNITKKIGSAHAFPISLS